MPFEYSLYPLSLSLSQFVQRRPSVGVVGAWAGSRRRDRGGKRHNLFRNSFLLVRSLLLFSVCFHLGCRFRSHFDTFLVNFFFLYHCCSSVKGQEDGGEVEKSKTGESIEIEEKQSGCEIGERKQWGWGWKHQGG